MRHYILTALLLVNVLTLNAQTPFDGYALEHRDKVIIELQNDEPFRVENADIESKARYAEFDSKTLCINILDSANNIIAIVVLEPDDKKFMTIDPLSDKYPSTSPYAYCANNPVMFVDPDGRDPIYARNGRGGISKIGDDGECGTNSYLVFGSVAQQVRRATAAGNFYTGNLNQSRNVQYIPTRGILDDVQKSVDNTIYNNPLQVEHGAHVLHGEEAARHWDQGTPPVEENDKIRRSIIPFQIDGRNQSGGSHDKLKYIWHTHLIYSNPSKRDTGYDLYLRDNGSTSTTFLIDTKHKIVTFYHGSNMLIKVDYEDFIKMGNQQDNF